MLSTSHNRAYQHFLTLLTGFHDFVLDSALELDFVATKQKFNALELFFQENIFSLNSEGMEATIISRWESIQREIKREFKLLKTDILFLASARQTNNKIKRLNSIADRLKRLIYFCQGLLQVSN